MTKLDLDILRAYQYLASANGCLPDIRAVAHRLRRSTSHIHGRLEKLQADGLMTHTPHTARTWRLTAAGERKVGQCPQS